MLRYLELADKLRKEVDGLLNEVALQLPKDGRELIIDSLALRLAHIVNLSVRCNPRQPQGTVRKNIVALAVRDYCVVSMTKELDESTGREYNKIHIGIKGAK